MNASQNMVLPYVPWSDYFEGVDIGVFIVCTVIVFLGAYIFSHEHSTEASFTQLVSNFKYVTCQLYFVSSFVRGPT